MRERKHAGRPRQQHRGGGQCGRTRGTLRYRHGSNLPCVPADPLKPAVCNESIIQFEENSHVEVLCLVNYMYRIFQLGEMRCECIMLGEKQLIADHGHCDDRR